MTITHKIEDFLFELFPEIEDHRDTHTLKQALTNYYSYGPFKPTVHIKDGWVTIEIDTARISSEESDYSKVVRLSEQRKYAEAKKILQPLIERNPTNSEYH